MVIIQPCKRHHSESITKQEAQLLQRNSASAAHAYLSRLQALTYWSCNAQNTAESQMYNFIIV